MWNFLIKVVFIKAFKDSQLLVHSSNICLVNNNFIYSFITNAGVGGKVVSIAAFQAVDPGSIPGQRNVLFLFLNFSYIF